MAFIYICDLLFSLDKGVSCMNTFQNKNTNVYLLLLFLLGIVVNMGIISIPGYFSHDELEIINTQKISINPDSAFFRPLGYILLYYILKYHYIYFIPHFIVVFLHIVNGILLFRLLDLTKNQVKIISSTKDAFYISLIFISSPLTTFSVSWIASIYDILLVFFILLTLIFIYQFIILKRKISLIFSLITTICAFLSKETSIVIPFIVFVYLIILNKSLYKKETHIILSLILLITIIYFVFRFPYLISLQGGYKISLDITNLLKNFLAYIAFPFYVEASEITGITEKPILSYFGLSLILMFLTSVLIIKAYSFHTFLILFILYFLYILPVLPIQKYETQYLYGSAIPFSIMLYLLLIKRQILKFIGIFLMLILMLHTFQIQKTMYITGLCQSKILLELDTLKRNNILANNTKVKIFPEEDSKWWILARAIYAYKDEYEVTSQKSNAHLIFDKNCNLTIIDKHYNQ